MHLGSDSPINQYKGYSTNMFQNTVLQLQDNFAKNIKRKSV